MIRHTNAQDFEFVDSIGTNSYPFNYYEGIESFHSKMVGYPEGCFVCEINKEIVGYIISFPYVLWQPYPINQNYTKVENPDCYYIHDLCIDEKHRGKGYAISLVDEVLKIKQFPKVLVSVLNSENFWGKFGFQKQKSFDYCGLNATYMVK
jgi:ribosomal protein S18 acetylase RimI-like enzyme